MTRFITAPAPAKINIGLFITSFDQKKQLHTLETTMVQIPLYDLIEIELPSQQPSITYTGTFATGINIHESSCYRLIAELNHSQLLTSNSFSIKVWKAIPQKSGLGGAATDAATLYHLLTQLNLVKINSNQLIQNSLASIAGTDSLFFLKKHPKALVKGTGDIIEPVKTTDTIQLYLVLLMPPFGFSTREMYNEIKKMKLYHQPNFSWHTILQEPGHHWQKYLQNTFLTPAIKKRPEIKQYINTLKNAGAFFTSLSGSGSTVYGLFFNEPDLSWISTQTQLPCKHIRCFKIQW